MTDKKRYIRLREGLAIFLPNAHTKTWWCRTRENKEDFKFSLQTREREEAEDRAISYRIAKKNGDNFDVVKISKTTFSKYDEELQKYILDKFSKNSVKGIIRQYQKYFLPEFKSTDIHSVLKSDLQNVIEKHELKRTVLRDFRMATNAVFEFLDENNYIQFKPTFPKPNKQQKQEAKSESYDSFNDIELSYVYNKIWELLEGNNRNYINKHEHIYEILLYYTMVVFTGSRPSTEITKIRFEDFEKVDENQYNLKIINGKNSETHGKRIIPIHKDSIGHIALYIGEIRGIRLTMKGENGISGMLEWFDNKIQTSSDLIFKNLTYSIIYGVFKTAVKIGVDTGNVRANKNFAPYSFRHSYINRALRQGMDVYLLSKAVGNTVAMVQNFYDSMDVVERKSEVLAIKSPFKRYDPDNP
jgi:integrase